MSLVTHCARPRLQKIHAENHLKKAEIFFPIAVRVQKVMVAWWHRYFIFSKPNYFAFVAFIAFSLTIKDHDAQHLSLLQRIHYGSVCVFSLLCSILAKRKVLLFLLERAASESDVIQFLPHRRQHNHRIALRFCGLRIKEFLNGKIFYNKL